MSQQGWEILFDHYGKPADVLYIKDTVIPEPGAGEIRVKLIAAPIHPSALYAIQGTYGRPEEEATKPFPRSPGNEGVGIVDKIGAGETQFSVGQRVFLTGGATGVWKEYQICNQAYVVAIPDDVPTASAAQLLVNPITAWAMADEFPFEQGEYILQSAAASTLGIMFATQIAKIKGFKTINIVRRQEQVDELKRLGADEVLCINDSNLSELVPKVKALTQGKGVRFAIDAVGGALAAEMLNSLAPFGTMLVYGVLSGDPIPVSGGKMLFNDTTVKGFWLSSWIGKNIPRFVSTRKEVLRLMGEGKIVPPVMREVDFKDFKQACIDADSPGRLGKIILVNKSA